MALIAVVAANVRPANANQCMIRTLTSGVAVDVGESVFIDPADGKAKLANGGAAGTLPAIGIVVAIGTQGAVVGIGAGEALSVVLYGPVAGFTLDPGDPIYQSNTAGALGDAAGTVSQVVGIGLPDSLLFVNPQL